MEDLELLKKDWNKNEEIYKKYSENDIYKMIRKKSISLSMLLFFVGVLEICIWMFLDYFYGLQVPYLRYGIFLFFIILMVYWYYQIKITTGLKRFMKTILKLRLTVLIYVIFTILFMLYDIVFDYKSNTQLMIAGFIDGLYGNYKKTEIKNIEPDFISYTLYILTVVFFLWILYSVYKCTYGKLLKKLKLNYKELTKLEESNA